MKTRSGSGLGARLRRASTSIQQGRRGVGSARGSPSVSGLSKVTPTSASAPPSPLPSTPLPLWAAFADEEEEEEEEEEPAAAIVPIDTAGCS